MTTRSDASRSCCLRTFPSRAPGNGCRCAVDDSHVVREDVGHAAEPSIDTSNMDGVFLNARLTSRGFIDWIINSGWLTAENLLRCFRKKIVNSSTEHMAGWAVLPEVAYGQSRFSNNRAENSHQPAPRTTGPEEVPQISEVDAYLFWRSLLFCLPVPTETTTSCRQLVASP